MFPPRKIERKKDQIKSKENIKEKIVKIRTNVNEIGKKLQ